MGSQSQKKTTTFKVLLRHLLLLLIFFFTPSKIKYLEHFTRASSEKSSEKKCCLSCFVWGLCWHVVHLRSLAFDRCVGAGERTLLPSLPLGPAAVTAATHACLWKERKIEALSGPLTFESHIWASGFSASTCVRVCIREKGGWAELLAWWLSRLAASMSAPLAEMLGMFSVIAEQHVSNLRLPQCYVKGGGRGRSV